MKLIDSAKVLGISKKSLDDYFLVLRVGEILGFNYAENLDNGMGELRAFIKGRGESALVKGKLGKEVKCFGLVGGDGEGGGGMGEGEEEFDSEH